MAFPPRQTIRFLTTAALPLVTAVISAQGLAATNKSASDLQTKLQALAHSAQPATLGIAVVDLHTGSHWAVNTDRTYPMMSVFKAPVAATILSRIDSGALSMDQQVTIRRSQLDSGSAVPSIGDNFTGEQMTFSLRQLLIAAVSQSDNTAVDALLRLLGGPDPVTQFLQLHGINQMHVDEDEASVSKVFANLHGAAAPPATETPADRTLRLRRGYAAYLADPRNHTTPDAAASFLQKLWSNQLLSPTSTKFLLGLMYDQTTPHRLRDGLPPQVLLADKCGTSNTVDGHTAAYNDIGLLTWPDGHTVIIAAFLTDSTASKSDRDALFVDLARETAAALHPVAQ